MEIGFEGPSTVVVELDLFGRWTARLGLLGVVCPSMLKERYSSDRRVVYHVSSEIVFSMLAL